jgi:1-pyrroline-5-carboxylate dehydrogenase
MYRFSFRRYASTFSLRYTTKNEPILEYRRGSSEIKQVQNALEEYKSTVTRIPCIVDGKEIWTKAIQKQVLPFDHQHVLAEYCYADQSVIQKAIDSAVKNQFKWDLMPVEQRANIFLKVLFVIFLIYELN